MTDILTVCANIERIIAEHGFKPEYYPGMKIPGVKRKQGSYFDIQINDKLINHNDLSVRGIYAIGSIYWEGYTSDADEFRTAAAQIKDGADLIDAINSAGFIYRLDSTNR